MLLGNRIEQMALVPLSDSKVTEVVSGVIFDSSWICVLQISATVFLKYWIET